MNNIGLVFKFEIKQISQDLFSAYFDKTFNLVHGVSQDFGISKNITPHLKNKYGELMAQTKKMEQIAFFIFGNKFIIYYKLRSEAFMFNIN